MKIKKITKIFMALIITLLLATNISNALGTEMYNKIKYFIDNYNTTESENEKKIYIESFLNENGLTIEKLNNYIGIIANDNYTSANMKAKCIKILKDIEIYQYNKKKENKTEDDEKENKTEDDERDDSTSEGGTSGIDIDTGDLKDIYGKQDSTFDKIGGRIIGVATYLCYAAAVIVLVYKGVQFMQKAPEAKAEAKKELVSYAIGAFILFGIGGILQIIGTIAKNSLF